MPQSAAFDEPVEVLAAGVAEEPSFDDDDEGDGDVDDPFEDEPSDDEAAAALRLSVR